MINDIHTPQQSSIPARASSYSLWDEALSCESDAKTTRAVFVRRRAHQSNKANISQHVSRRQPCYRSSRSKARTRASDRSVFLHFLAHHGYSATAYHIARNIWYLGTIFKKSLNSPALQPGAWNLYSAFESMIIVHLNISKFRSSYN